MTCDRGKKKEMNKSQGETQTGERRKQGSEKESESHEGGIGQIADIHRQPSSISTRTIELGAA